MSDERRARAEAQVEKLRAHFPDVWMGGVQREMLTRQFMAVERQAEARILAKIEELAGHSASQFNPSKDMYEVGWCQAISWILERAKALREEGGQNGTL